MLVLSIAFGLSSQAQQVKIGGQIGGFGSNDSSSIGFGALIDVNPYDWISFQADGAYGTVSGNDLWYVSPALVVYPVDYSEFKLGLIGGAGFYGFPEISTKFGLNLGATGDFALTDSFVVGMQTRYHWVFDSTDDLWSVFITAAYRFDVGGGW